MGPWTKPLISLKSHSYDPGPYSCSPHGIPYLSRLWTGRSRMWAGTLLPNPGQLSTVPGGNTPHATKPFQPSQQAKGQAVSVRGQHGQQLPSYYSPYCSSTFPIGQLWLSRCWDIPQRPGWWRGRCWPQECSEGGRAVVGSPQLAPYFHITNRQESLVESQIFKIFTKRQKCRVFFPPLMWNLYF